MEFPNFSDITLPNWAEVQCFVTDTVPTFIGAQANAVSASLATKARPHLLAISEKLAPVTTNSLTAGTGAHLLTGGYSWKTKGVGLILLTTSALQASIEGETQLDQVINSAFRGAVSGFVTSLVRHYLCCCSRKGGLPPGVPAEEYYRELLAEDISARISKNVRALVDEIKSEQKP